MILSHFFLFPKSGHVDRKRILDIMSSFYDNAIEAVRSSLQNPRKCKFLSIQISVLPYFQYNTGK